MITGWILLLIALAEAALGFWFLTKYQKNQATTWFGLFCLAASFYVGSNGLGYLGTIVSPGTAERIGWAGGSMATAVFLAFSFTFPLPYKKIQEVLPWVLWPILLFVPGFLFTDVFIENTATVSFGKGIQTDPGLLFWFFLIFFGAYWGWSIFNLIKHMLKADGIHRWQLRTILLGISISLLITTAIDVVLPLVSVSNHGYLGSLFTSAWVLGTAYILVKK